MVTYNYDSPKLVVKCMHLCLVAVKKYALNKNMHLIKKLNKHHRWSRHQGLMPRVERSTTTVDENEIESIWFSKALLSSLSLAYCLGS